MKRCKFKDAHDSNEWERWAILDKIRLQDKNLPIWFISYFEMKHL